MSTAHRARRISSSSTSPRPRSHLAATLCQLELNGRRVDRPDLTIATTDHNTPTGPEVIDDLSRKQLEAQERLLGGWDEIGLSLLKMDKVNAFEAGRPAWMPVVR